MEEIYLEAEVRKDTEIGRGKILRRMSFVPSVVYGEGKETLPLKIQRSHLIKFMHAHHGGENMVINLKVSSPQSQGSQAKPVIIKEIQTHPVSGDILHLDFNEISLTKRIVVKVPVVGRGEPVGVKQDGGTLEHVLWEIEIECLPTKIPEKIEVDLSSLKIGDSIQVKDIAAPEGALIKQEADAVLFSVAAPYKEEAAAEAVVEGAVSSEPEVIKKEKKEAPGAEEEAKGESKEK